jgi:hypothetical protein
MRLGVEEDIVCHGVIDAVCNIIMRHLGGARWRVAGLGSQVVLPEMSSAVVAR